jgi:ParB-like chromosome segregation protein Spo0J
MHKLDRRSQRVAAPQEAAGKLTVVYQPIAELTPDPKNPRLHSRRQVRQIARSIETFGFNVPILVDRDHKVIAGHGRLLAARELGWSEVPTIQLEHLTEAQVKAFMIADNRLTEIGVWDDRLLASSSASSRNWTSASPLRSAVSAWGRSIFGSRG